MGTSGCINIEQYLSDGEGMVLQLIYVANASPSPRGSSSYIRRNDAQLTMSRRLVQQIEKAKEERVSQVTKEENVPIEQEIECPRCYDVMTLHSEFDRLGYFCEECSFSLYLSH